MEQKIKQIYQKSKSLRTEEKIERLETLLIICEDTDNAVYEYLTRLELIKIYQRSRYLSKAIQHYRECIDLQLNNNFNAEPLFNLFPFVAKHIDATIDLQRSEIVDFFNKMKTIFEINSTSLRCYYQEYYNYQMRVGKWEEGFITYSRWMVESRSGYSESIGEEEADRAFYYFTVGDYQNGRYVFKTVEKGIECSPGTKAYAFPRAVRYFLELKDWEMTSFLIQKGYSFCKDKVNRIEGIAEIIKPLSILNPKMALKLWRHHRYDFQKTDNHRAKYSFDISTYLLRKVLKSSITDEETLNKMADNVKEMYDIQAFMDKRNETEVYHDELMYWLDLQKMFYKENPIS